MSNKAYNWALNIPLKGSQKGLLLIIANAIGKDGYCFPDIEKLMQWSGYSRRTVINNLKDLVDNKIINRKYKHSKEGYRKKTFYSINFDLKIDQIDSKILSANIAPRQKDDNNLSAESAPSFVDNLFHLSANTARLSADFALNQILFFIILFINPKNNHSNNSLVDNFFEQTKQTEQPTDHQKLQALLSINFEQLKKVWDDDYDIQNARRLFFKICLENKHPEQFAKFLLTERKRQKIDYDSFRKSGYFVAAPCSLTNWLRNKRWDDKIKPMGEKKKVSPFVKCKCCGEEYLKGSYCNLCVEREKPRMAIYA